MFVGVQAKNKFMERAMGEKLAINNGPKTIAQGLPSWPQFDDRAISAVETVLRSGKVNYWTGPKGMEFEKKYAAWQGSNFAVSVSNGTAGLHVALTALGIGPGDEVIVPSYTFIATSFAVVQSGAIPRFADVNIDDHCMSIESAEKLVNERTKAIIPVHLYGQCADMDPILELAQKHNLCVIEDAAQAIGAKYRGREAGSMGNLNCLSFFPTKNLGGYGDGGMILTNDAESAEKLKILRAHGSKPKYYHSVVGCNSRLDAIQAAILLAKLKHLDRWNEARRQNAEVYNSLLADVDVVTPYAESSNSHIYNQYVIRVENRDELKAFLKEKGVGTEIYYPVPLHLQECYSELGYRPGDMPVSEEASRQVLALPVYAELAREQQEQIVELIGGFLSE